MMMASREAVVNYMTPLGLHHMMATGHHYGPGPWVSDLPRPEQNPVYFNRADATGVGFDRTPSGSDATSQYAPPIAKLFAGPDIPDRYLLWFHHVAWNHKMKSGRTLWDEIVLHYDDGIADGAPDAPDLGCDEAPCGRRALVTDKLRSWPFRKRKRNGGVTPASPISRLSRTCRCRPVMPRRRMIWLITRRSISPYAPGATGVTSAPFHNHTQGSGPGRYRYPDTLTNSL